MLLCRKGTLTISHKYTLTGTLTELFGEIFKIGTYSVWYIVLLLICIKKYTYYSTIIVYQMITFQRTS